MITHGIRIVDWIEESRIFALAIRDAFLDRAIDGVRPFLKCSWAAFKISKKGRKLEIGIGVAVLVI